MFHFRNNKKNIDITFNGVEEIRKLNAFFYEHTLKSLSGFHDPRRVPLWNANLNKIKSQ